MRISLLLSACALAVTMTAQTDKVWIEAPAEAVEVLKWDDPALSDRALERRERQGIALQPTDYRRYPSAWIRDLREAGAEVHGYSRWLNAVSVTFPNRSAEQAFSQKHEVELKAVRSLYPQAVEHYQPKMDERALMPVPPPPATWYDYGQSWAQTHMVRGEVLHDSAYVGASKLIAVIDGSFYNANVYGGLAPILATRVEGTFDFVNGDTNVFRGTGDHGTRVWSIIAAEREGHLVGSAPRASYLLLRSEDEQSESRVEEDNWIFAMEYADSAGADVINTSLGYNYFDDPSENYTPLDMDGRTAVVTYGAVMGHRTGMIVVSSAGNTGTSPWRIISAPADADSILAVGAVDSTGFVATFSARGPTADGRVKPDVMAQGVLTAHYGSNGWVTRGNGTSFSAPVMTGFVACFWEAVPQATNYEVMDWVRRSAHLYDSPNEDYGYGIPNFYIALKLAGVITQEDALEVYPNPTSGEIIVALKSGDPATYRLVSRRGEIVAEGALESPVYQSLTLPQVANGLYILEVVQNNTVHTAKVSLIR